MHNLDVLDPERSSFCSSPFFALKALKTFWIITSRLSCFSGLALNELSPGGAWSVLHVM